MGFNGKKFKNFKWEKIKINFQAQQKTAQITRPLNTTNEDGPCIQEEIKRRKIEKFIQIITIGTLQPRTKESFPDMFTSYVDLASHDMITNVGRATTCRCKIWVLSLQTKCTKIEVLSENMNFIAKLVRRFRTEKKYNTLIASTKEPRETHSLYLKQLTMELVTRNK